MIGSTKLRLWFVTVALLSLTVVGAYAGAVADVSALLESALPTSVVPAYIAIALIGIGTLASGRGHRLNQVFVQYGGFLPILAGYTIIGDILMEVSGLAPSALLQLGLPLIIFYFTMVYVFVIRSQSRFATWDAEALVILLSSFLFAYASQYFEVLLLVTAILWLVSLLMHVAHRIGVLKTSVGTVTAHEDGGRLYTAFVGFYIELIAYLGRVAKSFV